MPKAKKLPLLASGLGRRRSPSINRFPAFFPPSLEHLKNLSIVGRGKIFFCSNIQFHSPPLFNMSYVATLDVIRHEKSNLHFFIQWKWANGRCSLSLFQLDNDAFLGSRQDRFNEVTGDASSLSHKKPQPNPTRCSQVQCLLVSRRLQSLPCHLQPRSRMGCKYACRVQQCRLQLANIGPVRWSGKRDTKAPKPINENVHQTRLSHIQ
ncbi:putative cytosol aminopeptidase [Trichinella spiralis]|uniref:Cytosol aminopeptidase n=1 Tax=Trichinella spiralis TaxID=6334 RepID=A0ABR3KBU5_TRISP